MEQPRHPRPWTWWISLIVPSVVAGLVPAAGALANPIGPSGLQGISGIEGLGTPQVTINQNAPRAILNWQQFNIAPGEVTRFVQPSASSMALNRIWDQSPSQIFGSLQANGSVILLNPNGVMFGPNAQINVNGLIASSLNLSDENFLNGVYRFEGSAIAGAVRNAGTIETAAGGFVYLLAPNVENNGVIRTPEGTITLAAGTTAYLSDRSDGRGFLVEVTAPQGEALNLKDLVADGGRVNLYGRVVNHAGLIQANTVRENNGRIELVASEQVNLKSGSRIEAKGDDEGVSDGGSVLVLADKNTGRTQFEAGAVIDASGGESGGNGGTVELSGRDVRLGGGIDVGAGLGFRGGTVLIDPVDLDLNGLIIDSSSPDVTSINGAWDLVFSSPDDLRVTGSLDFNASDLLPAGGERTVRFTAGEDLVFDNVFLVNDLNNEGLGSKWNYVAAAQQDIVLTGSWLVTGLGGKIDFQAGRDIRLDQGVARSYLWAGSGSDLSVRAGRDLIAPSAFDAVSSVYSGIRLAGSGNLTMDVGGDFLGGTIDGAPAGPGFLISDGVADVRIGGNFGTAESYANLTLGQGRISTVSGGHTYLGLVQDKGLAEGGSPSVTMDPTNQVDITSTNGDVHLKPEAVARGDIDQLRVYYPASFRVAAPQGSIFVERNLTFWPSLVGSIDFSARDHIRGQIKSDGLPTVVQLIAADPQTLIGPLTDPSTFRTKLNTLAQNVPAHEPATIRFHTETGDIRTFFFDLYSPTLHKSVDISAGRDLKEFVAHISVPEGVPATVSAQGNIDMTKPSAVAGADSGLHFHGPGTGIVRVGGTLDVANSEGITHQLLRAPSNDRDAGGLLDIGVGGNLEMIKSRIVSHNGAAIRIHGLDGPESPLGGTVNVGTNADEVGFGNVLGIVTLRGGNIDVNATGNVEVNLSRVATFGGGHIAMKSEGDINAGSGGRDERVDFVFEQRDENGNVLIDPLTGQPVRLRAQVPGSGIFTFHPDDPDPLPLFPQPPEPEVVFEVPPFTPELARLEREINIQRLLGYDTAQFEAQFEAQRTAQVQDALDVAIEAAIETAAAEYDRLKDEYVSVLKLGDIALNAKEDIVVPPAGIRGRVVKLKARNLVLEGGEVKGNVELNVDDVVGDIKDILGPIQGSVAGTVVPPPIAPPPPPSLPPASTGSLNVGLSGSTGSLTSSISAASTVAEAVTEDVAGPTGGNPENGTGVDSDDREDKKDKPVRSVRLKRGVTIEVQVSPDTLSQN